MRDAIAVRIHRALSKAAPRVPAAFPAHTRRTLERHYVRVTCRLTASLFQEKRARRAITRADRTADYNESAELNRGRPGGVHEERSTRVPFPEGERVELNAGERKNDRVMTAPGPNGGCGVPARVREGQRRDRVITHRPIAVPRAAIMVRRGDVQSRAALRHPLRIHLAGTRDALVSRANTWSRYSRLS